MKRKEHVMMMMMMMMMPLHDTHERVRPDDSIILASPGVATRDSVAPRNAPFFEGASGAPSRSLTASDRR